MRLRYFVYVLVLGLLIFLQASWLRMVALWDVVPQLSLVYLVWLAHVEGTQTAQLTGFIAGIFLDLFSGLPVGLSSFILALTGFLFGLGKGKVFYDPVFVPMLMAFLSVLLKYILLYILGNIFALRIIESSIFNLKVLIEILYTAVLAPLFFLIFTKVRNRFVRSYGGFENG